MKIDYSQYQTIKIAEVKRPCVKCQPLSHHWWIVTEQHEVLIHKHTHKPLASSLVSVLDYHFPSEHKEYIEHAYF